MWMPGTRPGMTEIVAPILTHSFIPTAISSANNATNVITAFIKREGSASTISDGRSFPIKP
jgi:hypothetical protein